MTQNEATEMPHLPPGQPLVDYRGLSKSMRILPSAVTAEDLRRLYVELDKAARSALERHLSALPVPPDDNLSDFEAVKDRARAIGGLTVTVLGADGESVVSSSGQPLDDASLPDRIAQITFESATSFHTFCDVTLPDRFRLHLDFTEPPMFGVYNPWDEPTPNGSRLDVIGADATWVRGVTDQVLAYFKKRRRWHGWLHSSIAFNILNWGIGFPAALWTVYRLEPLVATCLSSRSGALVGAADVYVFFVALLLFRVAVWCIRWIFPVVEIRGSRSMAVRGVLGTAVGALLLSLVYDVLRTLLAQ